MKIGVVTIPPNINYGGIMQAYALQYVVKSIGHDPYLIMPNRKYFKLNPFIAPFVYLKRVVRKYFGGERDLVIFYINRHNYIENRIEDNIRAFVLSNIKLYNCRNISDIPSNFFDLLLVGSDQIWRCLYNENIVDTYLNFAKNWNVGRVSYAASFGVDTMDEYSAEDLEKCAELARKFNAISVREDSAVGLCRDYFGVEAVHLLDPTMLLSKEHYEGLIEGEKKESNKLFAHILDCSLDKDLAQQQICERLCLEPISVSAKKEYEVEEVKDINDFIVPSPLKWLAAFRDAEFVVTDSFHGVVFSIIFNKPFVAIMNRERGGARFTSLLKMFSLEDRLINSSCLLTDTHFLPIDYDRVNQVKKEWQIKSFQFLEVNLK